MIIGYVTLEETKQYINDRYPDTIEDVELKRALTRAFDKIEALNVRYSGQVNGGNNFPRLTENTVPKEVKELQMLEAYNIAIGNTESADEIEAGIAGRSIGDMGVSYNKAFVVGNITFTSGRTAKIASLFQRKTF